MAGALEKVEKGLVIGGLLLLPPAGLSTLVTGVVVIALMATLTSFKPPGFPGTGPSTSLDGTRCQGLVPETVKDYQGNTLTRDQLLAAITVVAGERKLPAALVAAGIKAESEFNPNAGSPVGARGIYQIMPETYAELNANPSAWPRASTLFATATQHPLDPYYVMFLGSGYLRSQYDFVRHLFGNKADDQLYGLAYAAYNAGPGAVQEYQKPPHNGLPPYEETRTYVNRIMTEFYPQFRECQTEQETTGVDSSGMHANIKKLIDQFNSNPKAYAQTPGACAQFTRKLLEDTFGAGVYERVGTLDGGRIRPNEQSTPPSQADLREARDHLVEGEPVQWHIFGEGCGTHWILLLKIDGTNITFYDPNGAGTGKGRIRTEAHSLPTTTDQGKGMFFGLSPISSQKDQRGFYYKP